MLNKILLIGYIGNKIEIKNVGQHVVASFNLATKDGKETEWHRIVAWNKVAEALGKYVGKGDRIYVEGRVKTRAWEDNGNKKTIKEVIANRVIFLNNNNSNNNNNNNNNNFDNDDIPF